MLIAVVLLFTFFCGNCFAMQGSIKEKNFKQYLCWLNSFGGARLVREFVAAKRPRIEELRIAAIHKDEVAVYDAVLRDSYIHSLCNGSLTKKDVRMYEHITILRQKNPTLYKYLLSSNLNK